MHVPMLTSGFQARFSLGPPWLFQRIPEPDEGVDVIWSETLRPISVGFFNRSCAEACESEQDLPRCLHS